MKKKKKLFGGDMVPNLQGFEFYKGGIFDIRSEVDSSSSSDNNDASIIEEFDWHNRHGANLPDSPYYDGDPGGSGWVTSVKTQLCGDCWAHAATGATESVANLFFNQHVDLNLSEQELVSCSDAGCCLGGSSGGHWVTSEMMVLLMKFVSRSQVLTSPVKIYAMIQMR